MRFHALFLAGALALGLSPGFAFGADAAPTVVKGAMPSFINDATPAQEGGEAGAPADDAPAAQEGAAAEDEGAAAEEKPIDVDQLIADYNATLDTPRTFTDQEREWLSNGLAIENVDNAHKGWAFIKTDDPNRWLYMRDGKQFEVASGAEFNSPPVATHLGPFTQDVDEGSFWVPKVGSEIAREVDAMFNFIMWTCYIFTALIGVLMVVFVIKYRRRPGVRADQSITHNTPLEIFWSVVPTILVAIMFWGGYTTFLDMRTPPPDALNIDTRAYQWGWEYTYPNGAASPNEFHVPANTPIKMTMRSTDVIHSFHFPAFRIKSDVLPDRYTTVWFDSGEPGIYPVYCSEYCGRNHANMYTLVVVEPREQYEEWLEKTANWMLNADGTYKTPLEIGKLTYERQGCRACHSIDGSKIIGPTFAGLWGATRKFDARMSEDSADRVADENYVRQSILDPHSQIVQGYGRQMANYSNMPDLQIQGLIAYLKTLADVPRSYTEAWE